MNHRTCMDGLQAAALTVAASRRFLPPLEGRSASLECFGLRASSTLVRVLLAMAASRREAAYGTNR